MGVLGSSAVSTASQATGLGKGSSVTMLSYDGKYPINNIISFLFYIITNSLVLNSCYLLL